MESISPISCDENKETPVLNDVCKLSRSVWRHDSPEHDSMWLGNTPYVHGRLVAFVLCLTPTQVPTDRWKRVERRGFS